MGIFIDPYAVLPPQGPRKHIAIPAKTAASQHVAADGLLRRCQHHLDGVP